MLRAAVYAIAKMIAVALFGGEAHAYFNWGNYDLPERVLDATKPNHPAHVSQDLILLLKGCLHKNEKKRWDSTQLSSCNWVTKPPPELTHLSRPFAELKQNITLLSTRARVLAQESEWHVLDLAGHEYPNSDNAMRCRVSLM